MRRWGRLIDMVKIFRKKYKNKSSVELRFIVDNPDKYNGEAVIAAQSILYDRTTNPKLERVVEVAKKEKDLINPLSLSLDDYKRAFSYRDVFTSITAAILLIASFKLIGYYSDEEFVEQHYSLLINLSVIIFLVFNHIIYKIEHSRANRYMGRVIHTSLTIVIAFIIALLYGFVFNDSFSLELTGDAFSGSILGVVVFFLGILFLEFLFSIVKILLKLVRCQIY